MFLMKSLIALSFSKFTSFLINELQFIAGPKKFFLVFRLNRNVITGFSQYLQLASDPLYCIFDTTKC